MDRHTRPHADSAALLTIDVQEDFTRPGAPAEIPGTESAIPAMGRLVRRFREANAPVVHVIRLYPEGGSNVDRCRRTSLEAGAEIVRPGTPGAEVVEELKPPGVPTLDAEGLLDGELQAVGDREWVVYKPRWGAFYRTPLDSHLDGLGVDTVVVCGCNFPNCPRTTVYEASERDYRIVFVPDATSRTYDRGNRELEDVGVAVWDTERTLEWFADA